MGLAEARPRQRRAAEPGARPRQGRVEPQGERAMPERSVPDLDALLSVAELHV